MAGWGGGRGGGEGGGVSHRTHGEPRRHRGRRGKKNQNQKLTLDELVPGLGVGRGGGADGCGVEWGWVLWENGGRRRGDRSERESARRGNGRNRPRWQRGSRSGNECGRAPRPPGSPMTAEDRVHSLLNSRRSRPARPERHAPRSASAQTKAANFISASFEEREDVEREDGRARLRACWLVLWCERGAEDERARQPCKREGRARRAALVERTRAGPAAPPPARGPPGESNRRTGERAGRPCITDVSPPPPLPPDSRDGERVKKSRGRKA